MTGIATRTIGLIILGLSLISCSDNTETNIHKYQALVKQRISKLNEQLAPNQIHSQLRNIVLLKEYAHLLGQQKPQYAKLADSIALDATPSGPIFLSLKQRYQDSLNASNYIDQQAQLTELKNLYQATEPTLFNNMLSDPVNVLADMSAGALVRVTPLNNQITNKDAKPSTAGQLVGNPNYGQWQTDTDGVPYWKWKRLYSQFSELLDQRISYDDWYDVEREHSYYDDIGHDQYSSPKQIKHQDDVYQKRKKFFEKQGKKFDSPYAKSHKNTHNLSVKKAKTFASKTTTKKQVFRSNYAKSRFQPVSGHTSHRSRRGK